MIRRFWLRKLSLNQDSILGGMSAVGTLELKLNANDYHPSRLTVDAKLSDAVQCKIINLVEDEIAAALNAEPTSTGVPPTYDDECSDEIAA